MSVLNQPMLCNTPEDGRIQVNCSGSLQSSNIIFTLEHNILAFVGQSDELTGQWRLRLIDSVSSVFAHALELSVHHLHIDLSHVQMFYQDHTN
jgi:hypothetical protein